MREVRFVCGVLGVFRGDVGCKVSRSVCNAIGHMLEGVCMAMPGWAKSVATDMKVVPCDNMLEVLWQVSLLKGKREVLQARVGGETTKVS